MWLASSTLSACSGPSPDPSAASDFDVVFEEVARVSLEEDASDPIADIEMVSRRPGGGYLVVDALGDEVRVFDQNGDLERKLGRSGDGPGELDSPMSAVEVTDGRVFVAQRANPRLTVFLPDGNPLTLSVPGAYGWWLGDLGDRLAVGIGSRGDRFALLSYGGDSLASFGPVAREVIEVPFWIYYAREHAAVYGDRIAINTSFYPSVRIFDSDGTLLDSIGDAPESWVQAGPPPVDQARDDDAREAVRAWSRSFSIVAGLHGMSTGHLVVQYGRFEPTEQDTYHVRPTTVDVYDSEGAKVISDVALEDQVLAGGLRLLVLVGRPPEPWTLAEYELRRPADAAR